MVENPYWYREKKHRLVKNAENLGRIEKAYLPQCYRSKTDLGAVGQ